MKIQLGISIPTSNTEFKKGHIYKHVQGNIYLCAHHCNGESHGRYLINLEDGLSYPVDVRPNYFIDMTDKVSLQDIKK